MLIRLASAQTPVFEASCMVIQLWSSARLTDDLLINIIIHLLIYDNVFIAWRANFFPVKL